MLMSDYQIAASKTAIYPNVGNNLVYPVLGLLGESGEVAEKTKKLIRDFGGEVTDDFKQAIAKELGDVLWYVSQICGELNLSMEDVAQGNLDKLQSRQQRGKLGGSGDDR